MQLRIAHSRFFPRTACAIAFGLALSGTQAAHAQISTTNLLTNPGAETGTIAGWTSAMPNNDGSTSPGVDDGTFDGFTPHTGSYDFYGGNNSLGTLTQSVTLVGTQGITATLIDAGTLKANVSFFEQGLNQGTPSDDASVTLFYLNGTSTQIGSSTTATVDSHTNAWTQDAEIFGIPASTRTIKYQINFMRNSGSDNDSFVDDTSLRVSSLGSSGTAPEPGSMALLVLGLTSGLPVAGMVARRRRCKVV